MSTPKKPRWSPRPDYSETWQRNDAAMMRFYDAAHALLAGGKPSEEWDDLEELAMRSIVDLMLAFGRGAARDPDSSMPERLRQLSSVAAVTLVRRRYCAVRTIAEWAMRWQALPQVNPTAPAKEVPTSNWEAHWLDVDEPDDEESEQVRIVVGERPLEPPEPPPKSERERVLEACIHELALHDPVLAELEPESLAQKLDVWLPSARGVEGRKGAERILAELIVEGKDALDFVVDDEASEEDEAKRIQTVLSSAIGKHRNHRQ